MGVASGNAQAPSLDAAAQRTPKSNRGGYDDLRQWHESTISSFCDFMPYPRKSPANLGELGFEEAQVKSAPMMLRSATEVLAISNRQGFPLALGIGKIMRGWCLGAAGQSEVGLRLLLEGIEMRRATGANLMIPFCLMTLAEVYRMAAQPEEGLDRLAEAARLIETIQERWIEAEVHRLRGTLLLSMHEQTEAEDSYRHALAVAQRQSAKFWELRAALGLARLWRDQGKGTEARDLLAPVYGWFTEGFDTPVLQDAKVLLDELA
jgi:predicted ATPase